jgi:hypothetical protein
MRPIPILTAGTGHSFVLGTRGFHLVAKPTDLSSAAAGLYARVFGLAEPTPPCTPGTATPFAVSAIAYARRGLASAAVSWGVGTCHY